MPPLTSAQRLALVQLGQHLEAESRVAFLLGERGVGKRAVINAYASRFGLVVREVSVAGLDKLPLLGLGANGSLLHVSGVEFASPADITRLNMLLRTRACDGWEAGEAIPIVATFADDPNATIAQDHWVLTRAPRIRVERRRSPAELEAAIQFVCKERGGDLSRESCDEIASACLQLSFAELVLFVEKALRRGGTSPALDVLTDEIATEIVGIRYRGVQLGRESVTVFLSQFDRETRPVISRMLLALVRRYFWTDSRFHFEIEELVKASGIARGTSVAMAKWQILGDSAELISAELKRVGRWRNDVELDLRANGASGALPDLIPEYLVIADDIVGSGRTVRRLIEASRIREVIEKNPRVQVVFLFLVACSAGLGVLREFAGRFGGRVRISVRQLLEPRDSCLDESSMVLPTQEERICLKRFCKRFAKEHGLSHAQQFGYGKCALVFSFHSSIPNNSLPLLWYDAGKWRPILPRSQRPLMVPG